MVQEEPADVDQGIGPAGGRCPGGIAVVGGRRTQRRGHHRPTLGIEGAVEHVAVIQGLGQVQGPLRLGRLSRLGVARDFHAAMARATPATVSGAR